MSHHDVSFRSIPYHAVIVFVQYDLFPCKNLPVPCHVVSCCMLLRDVAEKCIVLLCQVVSCRSMSHHDVSAQHTVSCYSMPLHTLAIMLDCFTFNACTTYFSVFMLTATK